MYISFYCWSLLIYEYSVNENCTATVFNVDPVIQMALQPNNTYFFIPELFLYANSSLFFSYRLYSQSVVALDLTNNQNATTTFLFGDAILMRITNTNTSVVKLLSIYELQLWKVQPAQLYVFRDFNNTNYPGIVEYNPVISPIFGGTFYLLLNVYEDMPFSITWTYADISSLIQPFPSPNQTTIVNQNQLQIFLIPSNIDPIGKIVLINSNQDCPGLSVATQTGSVAPLQIQYDIGYHYTTQLALVNGIVQGTNLTQQFYIYVQNSFNNVYDYTLQLIDATSLANNSQVSVDLQGDQYGLYELINLIDNENVSITLTTTSIMPPYSEINIWLSHDQPGTFYATEESNFTFTNSNSTAPGLVLNGFILYKGNQKRLFLTVLSSNAASIAIAAGIPSATSSGQKPKFDIILAIIISASAGGLILILGFFIYLKWRRNKKGKVGKYWQSNSESATNFYTKPVPIHATTSSTPNYPPTPNYPSTPNYPPPPVPPKGKNNINSNPYVVPSSIPPIPPPRTAPGYNTASKSRNNFRN